MKKYVAIPILIVLSSICFAQSRPFIPKDDQALPDSYGIKILYVNGKIEEFDIAAHILNKDTELFEFWTKDDICNWVPLLSIQRMEFDKRFSKMIAIKEKNDKGVAK